MTSPIKYVTNPEEAMQRQILWMQAAQRRKEFLDNLEVSGSEYSSAVAAYDKQNMQVFYV